MFKKLNILDEKDKRLRLISEDVTFPLTKEEKDIIKNAMAQRKRGLLYRNAQIPICRILIFLS